MTALSDTHLVILSTAAGRSDGAILPISPNLKIRGGTVTVTLQALLKRGFIAEQSAGPDQAIWRADEDGRPQTLVLVTAGREALGIECPQGDHTPSEGLQEASAPFRIKPAPERASKGASKEARIITLLARPEGATVADLSTETQWLPHTTRAALTRLRQKGHAISRANEAGRGSVYRIAGDE